MQRWERHDDPDTQNLHIVRLRWHTAVSPRSGHAGRYITIESPTWANVLALTQTGDAIMVRQYRHGVDDIVLEIPGGIVDAGEDPISAAARELLEETGYAAGSIRQIGVVQANPALFNNLCYTFLATDCRLVGKQELDESEDIEVHVMPLQEVGRLLATGEIRHALVVNAFFWYVQAGQPNGPVLRPESSEA